MISVIIIDDHPVVRRDLKQIIAAEQEMQVVGEAENAREAIRVIRQIACDAVVLDITLPDASNALSLPLSTLFRHPGPVSGTG